MFDELFYGKVCPEDLRSQEWRRHFFMVGNDQGSFLRMLEDEMTSYGLVGSDLYGLVGSDLWILGSDLDF